MDAEATLNISFLLPNFTFSDLNYTYDTNADWPAMLHPYRTRALLALYATSGSKFFKIATILEAVHGLLDWWLSFDAGKGKSPNWWMNQVGNPAILANIAFLLDSLGELRTAEKVATIAATSLADNFIKCEPTNCIWLMGNVWMGAVLARNTSLATSLSKAMYATISIVNPYSPDDPSGIKPDASFMMHGTIPYSGGYGMAFAFGLLNIFSYTAGTACCALPLADPRWTLFNRSHVIPFLLQQAPCPVFLSSSLSQSRTPH